MVSKVVSSDGLRRAGVCLGSRVGYLSLQQASGSWIMLKTSEFGNLWAQELTLGVSKTQMHGTTKL